MCNETGASRQTPQLADSFNSLVMQAAVSGAPTPRMHVRIKGTGSTPFYVDALPDTGATRTIISSRLAHQRGLKIEQPRQPIRISTASGSSMTCLGETELHILDG